VQSEIFNLQSAIPKVTDFGLAREIDEAHLTAAGTPMGTLAYMPPEQIRDFRNVRPSSDIYAMGMTAYSLLTGAIALDISPRANVAETVKSIFEKPIIPMRHRIPDIPDPVAQVIERALTKDVNQRWPSAEAMRNALLQASGM
jgi:serine/threonine-protein kinase